MELLNESPPTGVLSSMNQAVNSQLTSQLNSSSALNNAKTNLSSQAVSNSASSQQSAAVFGSNSGALSPATSDQLNLRCSTNNLSGAFSSSSLCLALGSTKFQSTSSSSNSLKSSDFVHCSPTIPDSQQQQQRNNFLNCENSSTQSGRIDRLTDLSSFGSLVHGLQPNSSLGSPVSSSTTNSIKSSSSSFSSSSNNNLCFSNPTGNNNHLVNNNLNQNNHFNNLNNNSNLANLNSLSANLQQQQQQLPTNSGGALFCAQQLFNSAASQQKVKRTRQRVDAGEPRNSYASIANYATSRLGKAPRNFPNATGLPGSKGLFDQLGYLGLNALLTGQSFSPDDFLLQNTFANQANLVNSNLVNSSAGSNHSNPISSLLASLATTNSEKPPASSSPFNGPPPPPLDEQANGKLTSQQQQMLLNQSFHWNTNQPQFGDSPNALVNHSSAASQLDNQQPTTKSDLSGTATASNLIEPLIDTMAKSRFSEDAVSLEYVKGECVEDDD